VSRKLARLLTAILPKISEGKVFVASVGVIVLAWLARCWAGHFTWLAKVGWEWGVDGVFEALFEMKTINLA
jgi:hypothetical protein